MEETISKKPNVISRLKTELKKPFTKNMLMFSLGTIGRDFLYFLFNSFLMTFILFTKTIDNKMLTAVGAIIVVARIFDALNDPIMGGIVENTRTKWGKYKPWQLLGAVLTGAVIISVFCVKLDGWSYIGFLAFAYLMFSNVAVTDVGRTRTQQTDVVRAASGVGGRRTCQPSYPLVHDGFACKMGRAHGL